MLNTDLLVYIVGELAVLLLLVTLFLLLHVKKLKALINKLESKIQALRQSLGVAKKGTREALEQLAERDKIKPKLYIDYIDQQIEGTRDHHQGLNPDRDIVLDITQDAPMARQIASLRHALLIAEKEAGYAGEDGAPSWDVLQSKFQQIIEFYQQSSEQEVADEQLQTDDSQELEGLKKRVANLEGFKKLFFDMESKWENAKKQAEEYHEQLLALGIQIGGGEQFQDLMGKYANAFNEVGELIESASDSPESSSTVIDNRTSSVGKLVIANQEEMQRLRNMAVDQHKVISELKKQLMNSSSPQEQQEVLEELTDQLERQQRFLKEAETCSQLLEDELTRALEENQQLRAAADDGSPEDLEKLESLVTELSEQSRGMLTTIAELEKENSELQEQFKSGGASEEGAASEELQEKLNSAQQELLNLQTQHIELEERYLELKMKG